MKKKVLKDLELRAYKIKLHEDRILKKLRETEPGTDEADNLTVEYREIHKQYMETARLILENNKRGTNIAEWVLKGLGIIVPSGLALLGVVWQTNRLIEAEDKIGIMTSQASKKMQIPKLKS